VQSTEMRGASPSATATTVFLTRSFRNVSRTGSTEYQLHLTKVSDRDRNVNKKLVLVVFLVKFITKINWFWSWFYSFGLGLGLDLIVLVLVLTFWSCLHH